MGLLRIVRAAHVKAFDPAAALQDLCLVQKRIQGETAQIHQRKLLQRAADPAEAGPEPKAGGRVKFDVDKKQIILFVNGELKTVDIEFTDIQNDIAPHNPKLFEDSAMKTPRKFPVIDKDNGTITEYSKRLRKLLTFKVPAEYMNLPADTWEAGDEVRIYYKPNAKHQALRFMNITQTNIFKK